jgi:hypothetical protein
VLPLTFYLCYGLQDVNLDPAVLQLMVSRPRILGIRPEHIGKTLDALVTDGICDDRCAAARMCLAHSHLLSYNVQSLRRKVALIRLSGYESVPQDCFFHSLDSMAQRFAFVQAKKCAPNFVG